MADISARNAASPAVSTATLQWLLAAAGMMLALTAPAFWNGLPLLFSDTGGYLLRPITGTLDMGRSAFYGLLVYISLPLAFWPLVLAQAAMTAWIVVLTLRTLSLGGRPWVAFGIVVLLSACTSLAWLTAQLLPDIFFPVAVLALYLLAFRLDQLTRWERYGLAAVIAVAITAHMAALALAVALVAALWVIARFTSLPRPRLGYAAGAAGAGVALALLSNLAIAGTFSFTPGGSSFLFARVLEDGIVARYLKERCPDPALRICAYQRDLPDNADDWLWGPGTAYYKLGGHEGFGREATEIVFGSIAQYPIEHLQAAVTATLKQFVIFATEVSSTDNHPAVGTIADEAPQLLPRVMAARQQSGPIDTFPINVVHVPVGALALIGLVVVCVFQRRLALAPEMAALCVTVLLALAINAAICGIFAHPVDRYQSRLIPLAVFALTVLIARRRLPRRLGSSRALA